MMMGGPESSDQNRLRIGLAVLVSGVLLMLWAWGSWAYRLSAELPDAQVGSKVLAEPTGEQLHAASAMRWFLVVAFVVALVGLFGSYILLRISRRYRDAASRSPAAPTTYQDVWSMHKVSDDES